MLAVSPLTPAHLRTPVPENVSSTVPVTQARNCGAIPKSYLPLMFIHTVRKSSLLLFKSTCRVWLCPTIPLSLIVQYSLSWSISNLPQYNPGSTQLPTWLLKSNCFRSQIRPNVFPSHSGQNLKLLQCSKDSTWPHHFPDLIFIILLKPSCQFLPKCLCICYILSLDHSLPRNPYGSMLSLLQSFNLKNKTPSPWNLPWSLV